MTKKPGPWTSWLSFFSEDFLFLFVAGSDVAGYHGDVKNPSARSKISFFTELDFSLPHPFPPKGSCSNGPWYWGVFRSRHIWVIYR